MFVEEGMVSTHTSMHARSNATCSEASVFYTIALSTNYVPELCSFYPYTRFRLAYSTVRQIKVET